MTNTLYRNLKAALLVGVAVPSLALAACSSDEDNSSDTGSAGSGLSSDSSGSSDSSDSSDTALPGAPAGFELTKPGSRLKIGESAYVVTQFGGTDGEKYPLEYWKVTVRDAHDVPVGDIEMSSDTADIEKFVCMNYDLEFLGVGTSATGESASIVSDPDMDAVDDNGRGANSVIFGDGTECGIHESDKLPSSLAEVQLGKVYKGAELSYVTNNDTGISPTGMSFEFSVNSPGLETVDKIYWN